MPNYNNPNTKLTAGAYKWSATLTSKPLRAGSNRSLDRSGSYTTQPGATVGDLLNGITALHAQECGVPLKDVVLVRYSLREK
jgi:hypothetical protein